MKTKSLLLVLAAGLILSGCVSKAWYQPGVSQEQTRRDLAAVKARVEIGDRGWVGAGLAGIAIASSADSHRKQRIIEDLMEAHGYQFIPVSQIPTNQPVKLTIHAD